MLTTDCMMSGRSPEFRIQHLLDCLQNIHGGCHTRREKNGLHVMFACPKCLDEWGRRELRSKHLALNIEKYLGLGEYEFRFAMGGKKGLKSGYAQCMKQHGRFTMEELLAYPPLEQRGFTNFAAKLIYTGQDARYLIPDPNGNNCMIPDHPGKTVPLSSLPYDHPCMVFIRARNLDPVLLQRQFGASWCEEEAPEGEQFGNRWYRRHSDDGRTRWFEGCWKSTPQGRLILNSYVSGVRVSWQARYLETKVPGFGTFVFHPYKKCWLPRPPWGKGEDPVKYLTAPASERNSQLCGYDHACLLASTLPDEDRFCVLAEGPLDAARFPQNGVAVLGKYLSEIQGWLVRAKFSKAILAFDADKAGREACKEAEALLGAQGVRTRRFFRPEEGQDDLGRGEKLDPGGLTYTEASERLHYLLNS